MAAVRSKEESVEALARVLDDYVRLPGSRMTTGLDPLLGLVPVIGDAVAALLGASLLVIARQVNVPWPIMLRMGWNYFKNGVIGAVPIVGDIYSFHFKSNALNAALVLRAVKDGEAGACRLTHDPINLRDVAGLLLLIVPTLLVIGFVSWWCWDHNISYFYFFFMPPYTRR
jgi:uncharacterized protein DUF4112